MKRFLPVILAAVLALPLAACDSPYTPGPDGTVTDRTASYVRHVGWRYRLTTIGPPFRVTRDDYHRCFHGSRYPACTHRGAS